MAYKCNNEKCENLGKEVNPGGRILYREGKSFFTGSICKVCGKEMEHQANKMNKGFVGIKNDGDGRNL